MVSTALENSGDTFLIFDPAGDLPPERQQPFATIVTGDRYDSVSELSRPGAYRINIGLTKAGYAALFGAPPTTWAAGYAATDVLMPHPVYASQYWVCVGESKPRQPSTPCENCWPKRTVSPPVSTPPADPAGLTILRDQGRRRSVHRATASAGGKRRRRLAAEHVPVEVVHHRGQRRVPHDQVGDLRGYADRPGSGGVRADAGVTCLSRPRYADHGGHQPVDEATSGRSPRRGRRCGRGSPVRRRRGRSSSTWPGPDRRRRRGGRRSEGCGSAGSKWARP